MRKGVGLGLSFLDLICCAMGGAIVLALVFSIIKNPVPSSASKQSVLIRVHYEFEPYVGETEREAPILGIQVTSPGGQTTIIATPEHLPDNRPPGAAEGSSRWYFCAGLISPEHGAAEGATRHGAMWLEIQDAEKGTWLFSPYLVDRPGKKDVIIPEYAVWLWPGGIPENQSAISASRAGDGLLERAICLLLE